MSSVEEFNTEVRGRLRVHLTGELSRADTGCAGSDQIQRTPIAERILGLPREVRA
ncbi:hypothetical protein ACIQK6_14230 [Streptomyces sp. NPDC091682]|uniref:hypothetical protein n=1 Tax=Streptomyces sp. NPDC091682 TaxID=3366005 RepID=UPI00382CF5B4